MLSSIPMQTAKRLATYDDLLLFPEGESAEVIDGEVYVQPKPLPEHQRIVSVLIQDIGSPFDQRHGRGGPGGWWIFPDCDTRLSNHNIVAPDLVGFRRERLADPWGKRPFDVSPDWVCEVLSPSNAAYDRVKKANLYAAHGVPFMWLVSPAERVLEAFRLVDGLWVRFASCDDTDKVRIAPFDEVELDVGSLFPPNAEPTP
jgi:Uma2 family endonuclease